MDDSVLRLREPLRAFLLEHSSLRTFDRGDSSVVFVGPDNYWGPLDEHGLQLRSMLLEEYRRVTPVMRVLLSGQPQTVQGEFSEHEQTVTEAIEQSEATWWKTPAEAFEKASRALDAQLALLANLYDAGEGVIAVPDTNALYANLDLESWSFPDVASFELLLPPTVLADLDRHKVEHRNQDVRQKADSLIRRIKGYRNRGSLAAGVPLRKGISTLRTLATEPAVGKSLPWLDASNDDDRMIATVLEVMRRHPRSAVILVTEDINLQNKAELATVPYAEPPARDR
jgi:PIN domain